MTRPKRINLPFSLYHVTSRTNSGDDAFLDAYDENKFLFYLRKYLHIFSFRVHAWCFMPTHFHIILESGPEASLSEFMRRLLTAYTVFFNRQHGRHGHLFQGRFKSFIVDKSDYLLALSRYIHLNPVESKIVDAAEKYRGSSMKFYKNGGEPVFLTTSEVLHFFNGNRKEYTLFVHDGLNEKTKPAVLQQAFIGNSDFAKRIRKRLKYLKMKGSRTSAAGEKQEKLFRQKEFQNADRIIDEVAEYFHLNPQTIKMTTGSKKDIGKARIIAILLLGNHLPWTARQVMQYMNIKASRGLWYYADKIRNDNDLHKIVEAIGNKIGRRK